MPHHTLAAPGRVTEIPSSQTLKSLSSRCHLSGSHRRHQQRLSDTSAEEARGVSAAHNRYTRQARGHRQRSGSPVTSVHTPHHFGGHRPHPRRCHLREHRHGVPRGATCPPGALPSGSGILRGGGWEQSRDEARHGASLGQTQLWNGPTDWKTASISTGKLVQKAVNPLRQVVCNWQMPCSLFL